MLYIFESGLLLSALSTMLCVQILYHLPASLDAILVNYHNITCHVDPYLYRGYRIHFQHFNSRRRQPVISCSSIHRSP